MHIALLCQNVKRGEGHGRTNVEVVQAAVRRGHTVTLLAARVDDDLRQHPRVHVHLIPVDPLPAQLLRDAVFAAVATAVLRRHRDRFDVVFATGFNTWTPTDVCAVHFVHSAWRRSPAHTSRVRGGVYGAYHWAYSALHARLERWACMHTRRVVAVSDKIEEELVEIGVPRAKVEVLHNGVDLEEFYPAPRERAALGLPEGVPLALFAGEIVTPRKNLETVLQALVHVPDLHLAVAGAQEKSPYPALSEQLGLADRVHFLGFRRDVPDLMRASDLFVFPSRYEACTLVLLEAMAAGLPVVSARTAGGVELVTPEAGVILDDPDDVDALAGHLRHLAADAERRARMGAAARAVAEGHRWSDVAEAYVDLFERLAPDAAPRLPSRATPAAG